MEERKAKWITNIQVISGIVLLYFLVYASVMLNKEIEWIIWIITGTLVGIDFHLIKDLFNKR